MSDVALRFGARDDGLNAQFARMSRDLDTLQGKVSKTSSAIGASFRTIGAAAAAIGLGKLVGDSIQFADELQKASGRTGIAVEGLQRLQFIAAQTSGDIGSITSAINRMQNQLTLAGEGSDSAAKALARLQIPVSQFSALRPDEQFNRVAVAISQIPVPAERTAAAIGLFGRSGAELLPVLVSTGTELEKVSVQFDSIGGPVSEQAISKVDDLGDAFGRLKIATTNLSTELLALVAKPLTSAIDKIGQFLGGLRIAAVGGTDRIVNLTDRVEDLRGAIQGIESTSFFGFADKDRRAIQEINAEIRELLFQQRELAGLNPSPIAKIPGIDPSSVSLPSGVLDALARNQTVLDGGTAQQRRENGLSGPSPEVVRALEEKDLLTVINQEKLDELIRQQQEHAIESMRIESEAAQFKADVRETFGLQEITFERAKNLTILGLVGQIFPALAAHNSKLAKIQQAIAIATTIWDTGRAIMRAMAELPYPVNIGVAVGAAAMGAVQIAKIRATNYNAGSVSGTSAPTVSGGRGGAASVPLVSQPEAPKERGVRQINIYGDITGEASMRWLVDRLRKEIGDYDLVLNGNA